MSQPRSDWLFLTLRGLVLLVLGWAFGALYGLTSLGVLAVFLPVSTALLGFSVARATAAGWLVTLCACVGALAVFAQHFAFHSLVLLLWGAYIFAGLVSNAIFPRRWRITLQMYLLLLLMVVGAGMVWQAYPTLSDGVFRAAGARLVPPPLEAWRTVVPAGLLAGVLGGMTGLGGGYVLVPMLVFAGMAPHSALWLSLWLMLPLALLSTFVGVRRATPSWSQEGWLAAGAFLGGVAGATWAVGFSAGMLVLCFGAALTAVAFVTWRSLAALEEATSPKGD
ncbi:MAG: TSUP family transporter [Armatimonadota bacterium]